MNKQNVLFLNHKEKACGIYQYGFRSGNILKKSDQYCFIYAEINSENEYIDLVNIHKPIGIIYNYNVATMGWLNPDIIAKYTKIMHYGLHHEGNLPDQTLFNYTLYVDTNHIDTANSFAILRPLFEIDLPALYMTKSIPVISSFGFGFEHKGFERIVKLVNEQFDEAIIKLHISTSFYGDKNGARAAGVAERCHKEMKKDKIKLIITNDFLTDEQVLKFLSSSTINIFLYNAITSLNCGLSSVMDYALSVNVPLAMSKSDMFRHISTNETSICVEDKSLKDIINLGNKVVKLYKDKWSNGNFISRYEQIIASTIDINRVLGFNEYQPKNKIVCFLPFIGEWGWYLQTFVKRVHGYNHTNKIVCTKKGHECLFPTASDFYYDWNDVSDNLKAGILVNENEEILKNKIKDFLQTDDICFLSPSETSWNEKSSLAGYTFKPKSLHNLGLKTDVIITPRNRVVDPNRNWKQENWQLIVNELISHNISVGVCGTKETCFQLDGVACKAYEHIDVDSDVEMMNNAKLVITQESGLQYLSFMCQRSTFCIDHYHFSHGSDLHRNKAIPFKAINYVWDKPKELVSEILSFLSEYKGI